VWSSLDELATHWEAETIFEPQLPVELVDATYAVWGRAVEKSNGWAGTHPT
jgi:glycerol kinase